ncbi:MAG: FliM/FliN family flagellar motor switch protein [Hyphomonas sp.]|uniref:FliM/FliN family flagellar motor switch protein n=1 Tax=Hyphomonas sp. TaxID=87 RepID=UPI0034A03C5F
MTRNAAPRPAPSLPDSADDGWDMPPRREGQVMADMPRTSEPAEPDRPLMTGRGVLTPAEIQALLRPDLSDMGPEPPPAGAQARPVEEFAAESLRLRNEDHDIARRFAARLSMAMREHCGLPIAAAVAATGRGPFDAAVRQADEDRGQAIACFATRAGDIGAMLVLSPGLAQLLIETACGSRERGGPVRPLSPIDTALLEALVRPLAQAVSPELGFSGIETELVFAASIAPPAEAMVTEFSMRMQTDIFRAQLIVTAEIAGPRTEAPAPVTVNAHPAQGALSATLTARVACLAVPLSKLSGLKPGATLLLGVPADQPVELISGGDGGVLAAEAEIGRRGGRIALRITRRGPALGPLSRV